MPLDPLIFLKSVDVTLSDLISSSAQLNQGWQQEIYIEKKAPQQKGPATHECQPKNRGIFSPKMDGL